MFPGHTKIFSCFFLVEVLSFSFYIQGCDSFQVNFCVRCEACASVSFSLDTVVPAPFVAETILSLLNYLAVFVKNQLTICDCLFLGSLVCCTDLCVCS